VVIDSAINYVFPENAILAPQQYYVVAAKPQKFYDRYGMVATGNFSKNLSNAGEQLIITDSNGGVIMDFTFDDSNPWPEEADGDGNSLVSYFPNPDGDPNDYHYWKASSAIDGSPFFEDGLKTDLNESFAEIIPDAFMLYPNPTNGKFSVAIEDYKISQFTYEILDIQGTTIITGKMEQEVKEFNIESLSKGIYIFKLVSKNNMYVKKFILE
jgi:hypothetical protein